MKTIRFIGLGITVYLLAVVLHNLFWPSYDAWLDPHTDVTYQYKHKNLLGR